MLYKKRRFTVIDSLFSIAVSYLFSESRLIRRLMNFLKGGELPLCNCVLSNSEISGRYLIGGRTFVMRYEDIRELEIIDI
jgi:hypothetical protein